MDHGWDGDASEQAYRLFQNIADVFKQLQDPFNKLAEAYKAYAKFAYITASVIADLIKQILDLVFAYLTRTKGGAFAAVFHAMKIVKLVGKFGMTLIAARGTVGVYFGGLSFVSAPLFGLGPGLRERGYDLQGV